MEHPSTFWKTGRLPQPAALGVPAFACTPDRFPELTGATMGGARVTTRSQILHYGNHLAFAPSERCILKGTRSADMAKINIAFSRAGKTSTVAPKFSKTPSVTGTGSVYLSVRDVVFGPNRLKTFTSKSDRAGSADKK